MTMSTTAEFLATLRERDVRLWAEGGALKCDAPPGALDDALRGQLVARRQELLSLIEGAEAIREAPRSLVPLKPTGTLPALFARPGHNGDVFCYRALADHFDPRRPLYGVEPKGLDGSPTPETVQEMAAYEVEQIRALQPEGPYFLAGYCAGGSITFESARQLAAAGAEVARVVMFASPFPAAYRAGRVRTQLRSLGQRGKLHTSRMTAGSFSEGLGYVRERAGARMERSAERRDPALAHRRRVEDATLAAVKRYEPGPYAGRIDIFLPNEAWRYSGDRCDDWRNVAGGVVEHIGPDESDGDTMLREPWVEALAGLLDDCLRDEGIHDAAQ
jgi:thioesterase domain-containing protein